MPLGIVPRPATPLVPSGGADACRMTTAFLRRGGMWGRARKDSTPGLKSPNGYVTASSGANHTRRLRRRAKLRAKWNAGGGKKSKSARTWTGHLGRGDSRLTLIGDKSIRISVDNFSRILVHVLVALVAYGHYFLVSKKRVQECVKSYPQKSL